jgi:hypothetical protein
MSTKTIDDIQPKAVMTAEELRRWQALPSEQKLARLRSAIDTGIASGPTEVTMDQLWARLRARHPDAKL